MNVGLGSAVLMVRLDDLKGLFQSKEFHELVLKLGASKPQVTRRVVNLMT